MFGQSNGTPSAPTLPAAAEVAKLQSSLTQIIVSGPSSADLFVFLNGQPVPTGDVESLSVEIIAPDAGGRNGSVTAILSRYVTSPTDPRPARRLAVPRHYRADCPWATHRRHLPAGRLVRRTLARPRPALRRHQQRVKRRPVPPPRRYSRPRRCQADLERYQRR